MGFFNDIARAEREAEQIFGTTFTFADDVDQRPFRCVLDKVDKAALSVGEINQDVDATAQISASQLDAALLVPVDGTELLIGNERFVVLSMAMPTESAYAVTLKNLD